MQKQFKDGGTWENVERAQDFSITDEVGRGRHPATVTQGRQERAPLQGDRGRAAPAGLRARLLAVPREDQGAEEEVQRDRGPPETHRRRCRR